MSADERRLDELESKAKELQSKRSALIEQVNKWRDERDRINESVRKFREEAGKHRDERDRINARVADVKANLQPLYEELDEKRRRLAGVEEQLDEEYKQVPMRRRVERDLNSVEWSIMTTPTREMLEREDELVSRAQELRERLGEFKQLPRREEATLELTADAKATEMEIRAIRDEMNKLRESGQEHHEAMFLLHRKADEEHERADQAHAKFVEAVTEATKTGEELDAIMVQVHELRGGYSAAERRVGERRKADVRARMEELRQEALRKMAAGEKLNFDDLQFIYGGSDEEDDEDADEEERPEKDEAK
jgi:uncharacterized coiled-coil DUF342 family protein